MNILVKIRQKLINKLVKYLSNLNVLSINKNSVIHKTAKIEGSILVGDIHISEGAWIRKGVRLNARKLIKIGRYTTINGPNTDIVNALNDIEIGNFCSIARNVTIQEYNHNYNNLTTYYIHKNIFNSVTNDNISKGKIIIGHDVWIGTQSIILTGVTIGNGAIVAANSVVTNDVPPYAIVGGTPAKILRFRFSQDTIDYIANLEWWHWDINKLKENKGIFEKKYS